MTRTSEPDRRFHSAAIFAADGKALKENGRPLLVKLGWKNSGAWRKFENRLFFLSMPSSDLSPWEIGLGLTGGMNMSFDPIDTNTRSAVIPPALRLIERRDSRVRRMRLYVHRALGGSLGIGYDEHGQATSLSYQSYGSGTPRPPAELIEVWQGCETCRYTTYTTINKVHRHHYSNPPTSWTPDQFMEMIGDTPNYRLEFEGIRPGRFSRACDVFCKAAGSQWHDVHFGVCLLPETFHEMFRQVRSEVPGYFFGRFFASYRKGFDPYARPAVADVGETVRYPMVSIKRRRLSKGGEKDIDVDLVHRPQGDCYFDIQVVHHNPPDDKCVRQTLVDAISVLDGKAAIWDGDPMLRWQ